MLGLKFNHISKRGPWYNILECLQHLSVWRTTTSSVSAGLSQACSYIDVILKLYASNHYNDVIMTAKGSQITSLMTVYSTVYSDADKRKHQSSVSLAFGRGIHRWPVNSPHKGPVTRKCFHLMTSSWYTVIVCVYRASHELCIRSELCYISSGFGTGQFMRIFQGNITCTVAIIWYQWSDPEEYGLIININPQWTMIQPKQNESWAIRVHMLWYIE